MNKRQITDCSVQTDMEFEFNPQPRFNHLSRSFGSRQLTIDCKQISNTVKLKKINELHLRQVNLSPFVLDRNPVTRKKRMTPKSFHIETSNHIATPQQIKSQITPLHVRKLNYPTNPYRLKTCPDDFKFCDRILYLNILPNKMRNFDGTKALK